MPREITLGSDRTKNHLGIVEAPRVPPVSVSAAILQAGASIHLLAASLQSDGQLQIRGQVRLADLGDQENLRNYRRNLEVQVTLGDGSAGSSLIDAESGVWQVNLRPAHPLKAGESLQVKVELFGERGKPALDHSDATIDVGASEPPL